VSFKSFLNWFTQAPASRPESGRPFGSSDQEIKQFLGNIGTVEIEARTIKFINYIFKPSVACGRGVIEAQEIVDIDFKSSPITLRVEDELLFIPKNQEHELRAFSKRNNLKTVSRLQIWSWLLEPFLDTELTDDHSNRLIGLLAQHGISQEDANKIRTEVGEQMLKYNFDTMLWEWMDLGLYDVLRAMRVKYTESQFTLFYERVMRIALKADATVSQ
jgi:hypothetical protein